MKCRARRCYAYARDAPLFGISDAPGHEQGRITQDAGGIISPCPQGTVSFDAGGNLLAAGNEFPVCIGANLLKSLRAFGWSAISNLSVKVLTGGPNTSVSV